MQYFGRQVLAAPEVSLPLSVLYRQAEESLGIAAGDLLRTPWRETAQLACKDGRDTAPSNLASVCRC